MRLVVQRLYANESGVTAIEYSLICAIIGIVIIGISATGGSLSALYDSLLKIVTALAG